VASGGIGAGGGLGGGGHGEAGRTLAGTSGPVNRPLFVPLIVPPVPSRFLTRKNRARALTHGARPAKAL